MAFLQVASRPGLNDVPYDVIIDNLIPHLAIKDILSLATVSKQCNNHVYSAKQSAKNKLENKIKPEIDKMIKDSGITGIQMPEGSFNNSIQEEKGKLESEIKYLHQMRALTAFKKKLQNAITVLKNNNITDINNAPNNNGTTPLHKAIFPRLFPRNDLLIKSVKDPFINFIDDFFVHKRTSKDISPEEDKKEKALEDII